MMLERGGVHRPRIVVVAPLAERVGYTLGDLEPIGEPDDR
jgi:hypothetical protein